MKKEILEILKNNKNNFISGEELSNRLDVTRTSIWKHINNLKKEGYIIESISRKGYKLLEEPDILTEEELIIELKDSKFGNNIHYFKTIDSTNTYTKKLALNGLEEGTIVLSDEQTGGRGRLGRAWVSPTGSSVSISILLRPNVEPKDAAKITEIAAAATAKAIHKVIGLDAGIKWPNDIILENKKVCGILTEMSAELSEINYVIVGIGINVNVDNFPDDISKVATSLKRVKKEEVSRKEIVISLVREFERLYYDYINTGSLKKTVEICKNKSVTIGKKVKIISRNSELIATALDISENGELIVKKENGEIIKVISGEVSVRGLYGYV